MYDPQADKKEVKEEYGITLIDEILDQYDSIILAVAHNEFKELDWTQYSSSDTVIYDVKGTLDKKLISARL